MVLRLERTRHNAKKILGGAGHTHHAVRLEFADVDNYIRPVQPGGVLEGSQRLALGKHGLALGKITVEGRAGRFHGLHAGGGVNVVDKGGGVQTAGAVAHAHLCPTRNQQARKRRQQKRMRNHSAFRRGHGNEIRLERHLQARPHPLQAAHWLQRLQQRLFHICIRCTPCNRHIRHLCSPPFIHANRPGNPPKANAHLYAARVKACGRILINEPGLSSRSQRRLPASAFLPLLRSRAWAKREPVPRGVSAPTPIQVPRAPLIEGCWKREKRHFKKPAGFREKFAGFAATKRWKKY